MMRTKSLWAVLGCVAVLGLAAGCSDDDNAVCGDGVAEGSEQCDLEDLKGQTCQDVTGEAGTLQCGEQCVFDISQCGGCGNGIEEFGEECDCGNGTGALPSGCTAANGVTNANCTATCESINLCGDGVVTDDEDCDCGDPAMVTEPGDGCTEYNGAADSNCNESCVEIVQCTIDHWDECNPLVGEPPSYGCCPDEYGVEYECKASPFGISLCAVDCASAADCNWNNTCLSNLGSDMCYISMCGPGSAIVDAELDGPCQAAGGQPGYCWPIGRYSDTHDHYGYCIEAGTLQHDDACPDVELYFTNRDADGGAAGQMCDTGTCVGANGSVDGYCANFCDWEAEYDEVILNNGSPTCPANSNCFTYATISEDQYNPSTADYGWITSKGGFCMHDEATDPDGLTMCSLITGQLMGNPANTCADSHTDGGCIPVLFSAAYTNTENYVACTSDTQCTAPAICQDDSTHYLFGFCMVESQEWGMGSLIGRCFASTTVALNPWDACDVTTDICPSGTWCEAEDVFGAATGQTRCVPFCDMNVHDGVTATCQDLGAPGDTGDGTPVCTTVSNTYKPWTNGTLSGGGGADDTVPSRLGLCAFPAP